MVLRLVVAIIAALGAASVGAVVPARWLPPETLTASTAEASTPTSATLSSLVDGPWVASLFPHHVSLTFGEGTLTYRGDCNPVTGATYSITEDGRLAVEGGVSTRMACDAWETTVGQHLQAVITQRPQVLVGKHGQLILKAGNKQIEFRRKAHLPAGSF